MTTLRVALGIAVAIAWIPVFLFFFKNFRDRHNPVSLAIGTLVALVILYTGPVDYWITSGSASTGWVFTVVDILSLAVCFHFYLAIRWSKRKFYDERSKDHGSS